MNSTLEFEFSEVPLLIEDGFAAGLVSGKANVSFDDEGNWYVHEIYLDGFKNVAGKFEQRPVEVEQFGSNRNLYLSIWGELTDGSYKQAVSDAVQVALEEEGISPRSDYSEHSTMHHAFQGV
jgi:hypothetical protein